MYQPIGGQDIHYVEWMRGTLICNKIPSLGQEGTMRVCDNLERGNYCIRLYPSSIQHNKLTPL